MKKKKGKKYYKTVEEILELNDRTKGHLKSDKKRDNGKPIKEVITKVDNNTERRVVKDRSGEKTQVMFIVWRKKKLHHIHDKTNESIEIWQKEGNIYWDKEGNEYILVDRTNNTLIFKDIKGREYVCVIG